MDGYTREFARFGTRLDYAGIPAKVVEKIKWVMLDNLGVTLGATALEFGKGIAAYTRGLGDRAEATVLGCNLKSSTRSAAFANGTFAETLDMQDGYTKGNIHPSCGTVPAALAIAEWQKKTGKDLITAVVVGDEVGNRVAEAMSPSHLSRGFQPTGTIGTVGAAAAVANILGFNEEQTLNALSIAGFILPVSTGDNLWGGYSIKPVHGGAAAKAGIESMLLAERGFTGAPLEGDQKIRKGTCRILSNDPPKFEETVEGLGERYTIEELWFKPYASCRINHGPIEIAMELRNKHALTPEDIEDVLIKTYDFAVESTGSARTNTNSSFTECQFSMSYAVAGALIDGEASLKQLTRERISDPRLHALGAKVRVVADPELQKMYLVNRPAIVEITTKNGKKVSGRVDYPKGDHRNPMTETELAAKFLALAGDAIGETRARRTMDAVLEMEKLHSVEKLLELVK